MKSEIDHLPEAQRRELAQVQRILMEEFSTAIATATKPEKRNGKIYKIILFGSYARDDWVDEPENGYQSDYDLLIVVSHADLTDIADYWYIAEDKILRDPLIARPVNIIVHSLDEVNQALKRGEYFWVDIARDGIALYELPCHSLATPMPLTPSDAYRMAQDYFDFWMPLADHAQFLSRTSIENGVLRDAAFMLHQATERLYICFLLVQTLYFPRSHNIKFLRSLAEDKEPRLFGRAVRQHHLGMDDACLVREIVVSVDPLVMQSRRGTIGSGSHRARSGSAGNDFGREMVDRHDGNPLTPESARRHDV